MNIVDIFWPKICLGCGFVGVYICLTCLKKLAKVERDICFYCQKSSYLGLTHPTCQRKMGVDGFVCTFFYNDFLKRLIKDIKYRLAKEVLVELFQSMPPQTFAKLRLLKKLNENLFIEPIPLHKKRLRERGFNQAELISDSLAVIISCPKSQLLWRKKSTSPQAGIWRRIDRLTNLRGAFEIKEEMLPVSSVLLVDDVVTTGATAAEAVRTLKKAGILRVYVFALAKG